MTVSERFSLLFISCTYFLNSSFPLSTNWAFRRIKSYGNSDKTDIQKIINNQYSKGMHLMGFKSKSVYIEGLFGYCINICKLLQETESVQDAWHICLLHYISLCINFAESSSLNVKYTMCVYVCACVCINDVKINSCMSFWRRFAYLMHYMH